MIRVDLHTHSTASDGTDSPADLPRLAQQAGLDAFALTDHDTISGNTGAEQAAKSVGIAFVRGVELSVHPDPFAKPNAIEPPAGSPIGSIHLLGYHVRPDSGTLNSLIHRLRDARSTRNPRMIDKLAELGVSITIDEVRSAAQPGDSDNDHDDTASAVGRPHIAQVMVNKGYVKSIHEAFSRYLGAGAAAYVPRELPTAQEAIDAIHDAGGVTVLAHPVLLGLSADDLEHHLAKLADLGLDGIETRHTDHEIDDIRSLNVLAKRFDLITTGGSDYHGSRKAIELGSVLAPDEALELLEEAAAQYA